MVIQQMVASVRDWALAALSPRAEDPIPVTEGHLPTVHLRTFVHLGV